jgi:hypothetical protein
MGAPLGFKTFTTGDVLTAADTNGYLMQGVWTFASAAARDAAVTSPQEGNTCYLKDTDVIQCYSGSAWVTKSAGAAAAQNFTLISSNSLTASGVGTFTVSGLSGYNQILIYLDVISTTAANPVYSMRLNTDSTSKYVNSGIQFNSGYGVTGFFTEGINGSTAVKLGTGDGSAAGYTCGVVTISGANAAGVKPISIQTSSSTTATGYPITSQAIYTGTSVISSISLIVAAGTFDLGTIYVYGAA